MTGNNVRSSESKVNVMAAMQAMLDGVQQYLAGKTFVINRVDVKSDAIVAALQKVIAAYKAVDAGHAAWQQAVLTQREAYQGVRPLIDALRKYVAAIYGEQSAEYKAFGFSPRRQAQPSVEAKAAGVQKLRATRKARNTMGSRQRLEIKGTVPTASAPPSTSTAPTAPSAIVTTSTTANGTGGATH